MQIVVTNLGALAVPFSSTQDKGFAFLLDPEGTHTVDMPSLTVANVGHNPSAGEELVEGVKNLLEELGKLVTFWRDHSKDAGEDPPMVNVQIDNDGANGLRILLGSNTNEVTLPPGESFTATAAGYVEIRELGV